MIVRKGTDNLSLAIVEAEDFPFLFYVYEWPFFQQCTFRDLTENSFKKYFVVEKHWKK